MSKTKVYNAIENNKSWEVKCELKKKSNDLFIFDVSARGSQFTVCLVKWFEGYGFKQYGALVPNWNVGMRIDSYNEPGFIQEILEKNISNKIDRISLAAAITGLARDYIAS